MTGKQYPKRHDNKTGGRSVEINLDLTPGTIEQFEEELSIS